MRRLARAAACSALWATCAFAAPGPGGSAEDAVRNGLADAMQQAAAGLEEGDRYAATRALDRARHLASAVASSPQLPADDVPVFAAAKAAVTRGRHELQDGRPDEAMRALRKGAAALRSARLSGDASSALTEGERERAPGFNVLDATGRKKGELKALSGAPGAMELALSAGGIAGFGAHDETMRARGVWIGHDWLVAAD